MPGRGDSFCIGCHKDNDPHKLTCRECWAKLTPQLQKEVYAAWDSGRGHGTTRHRQVMLDVARFLLKANRAATKE